MSRPKTTQGGEAKDVCAECACLIRPKSVVRVMDIDGVPTRVHERCAPPESPEPEPKTEFGERDLPGWWLMPL